jgi:small neutral amino acid transporter SnatA (MarC family)
MKGEIIMNIDNRSFTLGAIIGGCILMLIGAIATVDDKNKEIKKLKKEEEEAK